MLNIKSGNHSNWKKLFEKEKNIIEQLLYLHKTLWLFIEKNIEEIDINKIKLFFIIKDQSNKFHIRDSGGFITGLEFMNL